MPNLSHSHTSRFKETKLTVHFLLCAMCLLLGNNVSHFVSPVILAPVSHFLSLAFFSNNKELQQPERMRLSSLSMATAFLSSKTWELLLALMTPLGALTYAE